MTDKRHRISDLSIVTASDQHSCTGLRGWSIVWQIRDQPAQFYFEVNSQQQTVYNAGPHPLPEWPHLAEQPITLVGL